MSDLVLREVDYFDAVLFIWSEENTKALTGVDPNRIVIAQQARAPWRGRLMERTARKEMRWCGTLFPTNGYAQDAAMSLEEYEDFVYGAGLLDRDDPAEAWRQIDREQQRLADYLVQHDEIRVVAPGTDLTCRVGGRKWENCSGAFNFPDGEVFTGPIEDSVNGTVRFTYPAIYNGREVEDVRLTFRDGKVIEATAARGQDYLLALIDQDAGARTLGEFAFGTNYGIQRFTRNILFDEKIGGTIHMALGQSYPETGGLNRSALHWDMICDMREGEAYADGERFYAQGKFTVGGS
jgi:aminopeptidase